MKKKKKLLKTDKFVLSGDLSGVPVFSIQFRFVCPKMDVCQLFGNKPRQEEEGEEKSDMTEKAESGQS